MTPDDLRKLTNEAIKKGQELAQHKAQQQAEKTQQQQQQDQIHAQKIIQTIPQKAEQQAKSGYSLVVVYDLKDSDHNADHKQPQPHNLQRVGKIVFDHCQQAGLNPTIEHWHDGQGYNSGYNITIHW